MTCGRPTEQGRRGGGLRGKLPRAPQCRRGPAIPQNDFFSVRGPVSGRSSTGPLNWLSTGLPTDKAACEHLKAMSPAADKNGSFGRNSHAEAEQYCLLDSRRCTCLLKFRVRFSDPRSCHWHFTTDFTSGRHGSFTGHASWTYLQTPARSRFSN